MSKSISPFKRVKVYAKTNGHCAYCGDNLCEEDFHIDHVFPKSLGGSNDLGNLMPSCHSCNASKGTKTLEHYRMYLTAKKVTGVAIFGHSQLMYLKEAGAFPVLGFDKEHRFHFEVMA